MEFPAIESMSRHKLLDGCVMRVWRKEAIVKDEYDNSDIATVVRQFVTARRTGAKKAHGWSALAKHVAKMARVAAVEVLNDNGDGPVIYAEWP